MPAPVKPAKQPPIVERLSPEDQISYLVHQHEEFADWRISVDERFQRNEQTSASLNLEVSQLKETVSRIESGQKDSLLLQHKILLAVQGQREPGLEVPGLTDTVKSHTDHLKIIQETLEKGKQLQSKIVGYGLGATAVFTVTVLLWTEKIKALFLFISSLK